MTAARLIGGLGSIVSAVDWEAGGFLEPPLCSEMIVWFCSMAAAVSR
jgi:hypothetical protein